MYNSFNAKKVNLIINFVYIFIIGLLLFMAFKYALPIILPLILSVVIAYIAEPSIAVITKQFKIKRSICSFITILFIVIFASGIVLILTITGLKAIDEFVNYVPKILNDIELCLKSISNKVDKTTFDKVLLYLYNSLLKFDLSFENANILNMVVNYATIIIKAFPSFLFTTLITFIYSIFVSSSLPQIKEFLYKRLNSKNLKCLSGLKLSITHIFKNYFKSYTLLMLITFSELSVMFYIFKIKPPLTLALIISLIDILPVLGVGTVMIPWSIVLFICGNTSKGIIILSIYALITTIRQIIEPKIVGGGIGLPPVITLPLMFVGLKLFGVIGVFLVPIVFTIGYDIYKKQIFSTKH